MASCGVVPASLPQAQAQTARVSQPGLRASYFAGQELGGSALRQVVVPNIDFDWGVGSPGAGVAVDGWCARYEGLVEAPYSGEVEFHTLSDDGIRLWVNGQQIINNWTDHGQTLDTGRISLVQGQKVSIVCEYYEQSGGATAKLSWNYSGETARIIPAGAFSNLADPDRTAPQVVITSPANRSTSAAAIPRISGTVKDPAGTWDETVSGVASVYVYLTTLMEGDVKQWNGTSWGAGVGMPATLSAPDAEGVRTWNCASPLPSVMPRGVYSVDVDAADAAGNWSRATHTIYITPDDSIKPEVTLLAPAENGTVSQLLKVSGTAFDPPDPDGIPGSGIFAVDAVLSREDAQLPYWNGTEWSDNGGLRTRLSAPDAAGRVTWDYNAALPTGEDLPPGRYILHLFAHDYYQNMAYRPCHFTVIAAAPAPDISIRALQENNTTFLGLGQRDASGVTQTKTTLTVPNASRSYILKLRNGSGATQNLKMNAPADAEGWTTRVYDGLLADETKNITAIVLQSGWPVDLASGTEHEVRVEVIPTETAAPGCMVPLTLSLRDDASNTDVARIDAAMQKLSGIEVSLDHGKTWADAPASGSGTALSVHQNWVIGLRAKRGNPSVPWPNGPFKPEWRHGATAHFGENIWLHFSTAAPAGEAGEEVQAECGNTLSLRIKVLPAA